MSHRRLTTTAAGAIALATLAVPAIAAAGAAPGGSAPGDAVVVDEALVADAKAGFAAWIEVNRPATPHASTKLVGCPAVDGDELLATMGDHGVELDVALADADWATEIEWSEYATLDEDMIGIVCGGDSDGDANDTSIAGGFGVFVVELADEVTTDDFITWSGFPLEFADGANGEVAAACADELDERFCLAFWHRDDLVLGLMLINDAAPADDATLYALLDAVVPSALAALGAIDPATLEPTPNVWDL